MSWGRSTFVMSRGPARLEWAGAAGHADRGGRECEKKILALVEWFRHANSLRQATGEGNQYAPVKFTVSKEDLAEFKWNKRRAKKGEEEEGSLQVRILRRCPWYKELEPVLRDRPSGSPLAYRDSLGEQFQNSTTVLPSQSPSGSITPCTLPSKRPRGNTKEVTTGTKDSPQNSLDIFSALNRLPSKQDIEDSETRALRSQETMASSFSQALSNMMTTNRATEMATKENIAISKMNVEIRIARSKMVVDLIRGNMDPAAAEALALRSLPDVKPSGTQLPEDKAGGPPSDTQSD
ncbi:hypothetical protein DFH28DRAFT_1226305 [Melampsora americana]|nr:hypothetical protein DFH28DRAFT_1226305 [Melampsora americana]